MRGKSLSLAIFITIIVALLAACQGAVSPQPGGTGAQTPAGQAPVQQATGYPSGASPRSAEPGAALPTPTLPEGQAGYPAQPGDAMTPTLSNIDRNELVQPGDEGKQRGNFFVQTAGLEYDRAHPGRAYLLVEGSLPTPCNKPRALVNPPNAKNEIIVDLYSVVDTSQACIEVIQPFNGRAATLEGFPPGKYTVIVDGKPAGELVVP